jgi:hypothetical protein
VSHKAKKKTTKKKSRKVITKSLGKRTRPVMYTKGKKVTHSPASKFARKGFRFNPGMNHVVKIGTFNSLKQDIRGHPIPHIVGMAGGFVTSGYIGGQFGKFMQNQSKNEVVGQVGSVVGNFIGTEIPAMTVHWVLPKVGVSKGTTENVCRGMRVGGYVAMGLNIFTLVLKVLKVPVPFRALGDDATMKEFVLSGLGDVDLLASGVSGAMDDPEDYAELDEESLGLVDEIDALSAYVGDEDDFNGIESPSGGSIGSLDDL